MGIEPRLWGPYVWTALHLICQGAPLVLDDEARGHYAAFFVHLAHVLPCQMCAEHLKKHLGARPLGPEIMTREHLIAWCIELHNDVTQNIDPTAPRKALNDMETHWKAVAQGAKSPFPAVCTHCGASPVHASREPERRAWVVALAIFFITVTVGAVGVMVWKTGSKRNSKNK